MNIASREKFCLTIINLKWFRLLYLIIVLIIIFLTFHSLFDIPVYWFSNIFRSKEISRTAITDIQRVPITIECYGGGLGNQMVTYATLYGLSRLNDRIPYIPSCASMKSLYNYFNISTKIAEDNIFGKYEDYTIANYLRKKDYNIPKTCNKLKGELYPNSHTLYHQFRDELRREFTFKHNVREYAENILMEVKKAHNPKVYVGVHVRRGDYDIILKKRNWKKFDVQYLLDAMTYFKKYEGVMFVVVSNDRKWCEINLGNMSDVYITPNPSFAVYDMAILAQCNHTIMTYGTFGYWSAYLAGGEAVYFANHLTSDSKFISAPESYNDIYLPSWIGIGPGFRVNG